MWMNCWLLGNGQLPVPVYTSKYNKTFLKTLKTKWSTCIRHSWCWSDGDTQCDTVGLICISLPSSIAQGVFSYLSVISIFPSGTVCSQFMLALSLHHFSRLTNLRGLLPTHSLPMNFALLFRLYFWSLLSYRLKCLRCCGYQSFFLLFVFFISLLPSKKNHFTSW